MVREPPWSSDSWGENSKDKAKMAEIGWFLHRLAGRVTPPSLGLVFLTGNMKGLAKRIGKNPSTCGKLVLGCCCCHDCYTFGFGFGAFGHVLSKCTSEFLSPISWAVNSWALTCFQCLGKPHGPFQAAEGPECPFFITFLCLHTCHPSTRMTIILSSWLLLQD